MFLASKDLGLTDEADPTQKIENWLIYSSDPDMLVSKANMTAEVSQRHC